MRYAHAIDWSSVTVDGEVIALSLKQKEIVRALWKAAVNGTELLGTKFLMSVAQSSQKSVAAVFRATPGGRRFRRYIDQPYRGLYRLTFCKDLRNSLKNFP